MSLMIVRKMRIEDYLDYDIDHIVEILGYISDLTNPDGKKKKGKAKMATDIHSARKAMGF